LITPEEELENAEKAMHKLVGRPLLKSRPVRTAKPHPALAAHEIGGKSAPRAWHFRIMIVIATHGYTGLENIFCIGQHDRARSPHRSLPVFVRNAKNNTTN
jgi:hypothetical protein